MAVLLNIVLVNSWQMGWDRIYCRSLGGRGNFHTDLFPSRVGVGKSTGHSQVGELERIKDVQLNWETPRKYYISATNVFYVFFYRVGRE